MKSTAIFYHAGCPVCLTAEQNLAQAIDLDRYELEIVHLGDLQEKIAIAKAQGVQSVPALVINDRAFHINFGAALTDLA